MSSFSYSDTLVIARILTAIVAFILLIYILKRVIQKQLTKLDTKASNYLYHKYQEFDSIVTVRPDLLKAAINVLSNPSKLNVLAFSFPKLFLFSHVFSMHNDNLINDNEPH
jgi:hypothetical protein